MNISILIPTLNRPEYLLRALKHLDRSNFTGQVFIGDSSDQTTALRNTINIRDLVLEGKYVHMPSSEYPNDALCVKEMLKAVKTKYVLTQGDDDLLDVGGLKKCIKFLDSDEKCEYSAAHGNRLNVYHKDGKPDGKIVKSYVDRIANYASSSAIERWKEYMRDGLSIQNFVHRTEVFKEMYMNIYRVPSRYIGPELLPCSIGVLLGKIKYLDCLSYVMQKNTPGQQVKRLSILELMRKPEWKESARLFKRIIVAELVLQEDIDCYKCWNLVNREFIRHLLKIVVLNIKNKIKRLL